MIQHIQYNAQQVQDFACDEVGCLVSFGRDGIQWLEDFINRLHGDDAPNRSIGTISTLGAFLGECLIHRFGGQWVEGESGWYVEFEDGNKACPFAEVEKHLENGPECSVARFYDNAMLAAAEAPM